MKTRSFICLSSIFFVTILFPFSQDVLSAQSRGKNAFKFTEASELTLVGKIFPDTPNPYHRVDTVKFKGFTASENLQVRESSGIAVAFKTNSSVISVRSEFGFISNTSNTCDFAQRGYDLYIKRDGKWLWAAAGCAPAGKDNGTDCILINNMDFSDKECLLYLPLFSEPYSVKIGVESDALIEKCENPFRYRIGIFGSSFTHGVSTSRSGMTYPAQLARMTGIQFLSLGCSGNCLMQSYFADALANADVDALIFDSFSNPDAGMIKERLFPFIERLQTAHPDIPLIFQRTIYREKRNFDISVDEYEEKKLHMADSLMRIACRKYDNVYYIDCTNATDKTHDTSVDGIHPGDYGYTLWAESIRKPLLSILRRYLPDIAR